MVIYFFTVLVEIFTFTFDWRSKSRKIKIIFHASYFMAWEIFYGITISELYKGTRKINDGGCILRASSEIIAMITCLFTSLQCSWIHIKLIRCTLNGVSTLTLTINILHTEIWNNFLIFAECLWSPHAIFSIPLCFFHHFAFVLYSFVLELHMLANVGVVLW